MENLHFQVVLGAIKSVFSRSMDPDVIEVPLYLPVRGRLLRIRSIEKLVRRIFKVEFVYKVIHSCFVSIETSLAIAGHEAELVSIPWPVLLTTSHIDASDVHRALSCNRAVARREIPVRALVRIVPFVVSEA